MTTITILQVSYHLLKVRNLYQQIVTEKGMFFLGVAEANIESEATLASSVLDACN